MDVSCVGAKCMHACVGVLSMTCARVRYARTSVRLRGSMVVGRCICMCAEVCETARVVIYAFAGIFVRPIQLKSPR